jgi:hypothetical protein
LALIEIGLEGVIVTPPTESWPELDRSSVVELIEPLVEGFLLSTASSVDGV